jgi:hypothetical protein
MPCKSSTKPLRRSRDRSAFRSSACVLSVMKDLFQFLGRPYQLSSNLRPSESSLGSGEFGQPDYNGKSRDPACHAVGSRRHPLKLTPGRLDLKHGRGQALTNDKSIRRSSVSDRRELYRSPNGDTWFLGREPESGHAFIIHQPNAPSGGRLSHIELGEFLRNEKGPEQQALLRLIGTLVDVPPFR